MSLSNKRLLVVAHPDDESLFFMGALLDRSQGSWVVACVTDGNADGDEVRRRSQFERACQMLGVEQTYWFGLPDIYEKRLERIPLESKLRELDLPGEVYTHGPLGEYMHPHHQDVCFIVSNFFGSKAPVYLSAYNAFPEKIFPLTRSQFDLRTEILAKVYGSETMRFINMLPARHEDGFIRADLEEVNAIYAFLTEPKVELSASKNYEWLRYYLEERKLHPSGRPF
jgi:LmbE family N-acetylglucosaminyl deacetylase